jgi:Tfp pilus assembly protein PilE
MFTRQQFALAATLAAAVFVSACHRDQEGQRPVADAAAVAHAQALLAQPAWLRKHLPANTVSYIRLPSLWQVAGGVPNGRALDVAAVDATHLQMVGQLREGIAKDPVLAKAGLTPYIVVLLDELRSPLEVALVDPSGITSPAAHGLVTAQLSYDSTASLQKRLESLKSPLLLPTQPFDAQGFAPLASGGWLRFDAKEHRLYAYLGMQPTDRAAFEAILDEVGRAGAHAAPETLAALEARVDQSGEGLFAWVSVRGVGGVMASQIPGDDVGTLPGDLVAKADAIAFGAGTVEGHGQVRVIVHSPQSRLLGYLAPRAFDANLKTVGKPHWAASVALPGSEQVTALENNVNLDFGKERGDAYRSWAARMKAGQNLDLAGFARLLGPELLIFSDDAGSFAAVRVRDRKGFADMLTALATRKHWRLDLGDSGKASVHALTIQGLSALPGVDDDADQGALKELLGRLGSHLYWIDDGDFLVFARVPQALADRVAANPDTDLAGWLKAQSYDGKSVLAGITASSRDAHRDAYYSYIGLLDAVGDFAGTAIDVRKLPSATALGLPREGVLGSAIEVDGDSVGFSLTYEQSPVEFVTSGGGGGMVAVAYVAVLAAIAVPAYQDYTIRAQVTEGMTLAEGAKIAVASYRLGKGRFPADNAVAGLADDLHGKYVADVALGKGGQITVTYSSEAPFQANAKLDGATLTLTPLVTGKQVEWQCEGQGFDVKYLPKDCNMEEDSP